jgi:hypothetical protein
VARPSLLPLFTNVVVEKFSEVRVAPVQQRGRPWLRSAAFG